MCSRFKIALISMQQKTGRQFPWQHT
uniref:Uncharacterized protein n=1 Tax=Anguilla anguilla TaxID=7936 RepID=A0A0E9PJC6_ANGAN